MRIATPTLLLGLVLAGCTTAPSGATGHCHAEHVQSLDVSKGPWASQASGSPREDAGARVYSWAIHRTGGCADPVSMDAAMYVVPPEIGCGGVDLSSANLTGSMTMDESPQSVAFTKLATQNASQDWDLGEQFEHESVDRAQPTSWNFTMSYRVPHDPLAVVSGVDSCVQKAVLFLKLEGHDWDYTR